jgi:hypothetical protein
MDASRTNALLLAKRRSERCANALSFGLSTVSREPESTCYAGGPLGSA